MVTLGCLLGPRVVSTAEAPHQDLEAQTQPSPEPTPGMQGSWQGWSWPGCFRSFWSDPRTSVFFSALRPEVSVPGSHFLWVGIEF